MSQKIDALAEERRASSSAQKPEYPDFRPGDLVRVHERVSEVGEEDKERIQVFEGVVIQVRGRGTSRMLTVRKESFGVGVEKILPLHSPKVTRIELVEKRRARRARLFYLRSQNQS
jgi:large subunit ribosomal protein L19